MRLGASDIQSDRKRWLAGGMERTAMHKKRRRGAHRRPFSSVWQAASMLDCTEKQIYHQIQEGRLPLAFDIARPGGDRSYLRLATSSVTATQQRRRPPADLKQFLAKALPEEVFSYKVPQVARLLECDPDHIYHLIGAQALEDIGGSTRYRVPRESLVHFLKERRVK
jgi:hypothetical protein